MAYVGKWLIAIGLGIAAFGLMLWILGKAGLPLGRLPGDVRIEGSRWSFYFPVATCLLISVVLTVLVNVFFRLFR